MNNKILQSLIDSGHVKQNIDGIQQQNIFIFESEFNNPIMKTEFNEPISSAALVIIQQALFDACAKRGYPILISDNRVVIFKDNNMYDFDDFIHEGNTTLESWVAAYKKVMGIV